MNKRLRNQPLRVRRVGVEESLWEDIYHRLLRLSWRRFCLLVFSAYLSINIMFCLLFVLVPGSVANIGQGDFISSFAFSVQTLSTIGYGYFNPRTPYAHALVTIEAFIGLMFSALLTGLVFAKFARPTARVVFSENILWTSFNGKLCLELRLGNVRTNRVFEGRARMAVLRDETSSEGEKLRRIYDLKLLRNESPLFALSWTLYHIIDDASPLHGMTPEQMVSQGWEINVTFTGVDQDMSQPILAYTQYPAKQIIRARKFADMIHTAEDGERVIDFSKLHDLEV